MLTDPLSDVLSLLKPRSHVSGGFAAGGDWSIQFPRTNGIKCYAVTSGVCWLVVDGVFEPVFLKSGDGFLLPNGRAFRLASDTKLAPIDAATLYAEKRQDGVLTYNGGGDFFLVGCYFTLGSGSADLLLDMLPPIVHLREKSDQATLRWSVQRMMEELSNPQPGGYLVAQNLASMMLVQALRLHMTDQSGPRIGWLFALSDPQISLAITAMHQDPSHRWALQSLAKCAGMSRSRFAMKFGRMVGLTPIDYLTRWRMLLAADLLALSSDPVSTIARSLGYESESAFSAAFKRVMHASPRQYVRNRSTDALPSDERRTVAADWMVQLAR
jgi:AraC-like DNA-binding protein